MSDLQMLLVGAVEHRVDLDVVADLRRGRSALRRRRLGVAAGLTAALIVVGGMATALVRPAVLGLQPAQTMTATVDAGAFEIPTPPDGWGVQAAGTSLVVIAPEGLPKVDLSDPNLNLRLMGKLVIELHGRFDRVDNGPQIHYDGQTFYDVRSDPRVRQVSVQEPSGNWLVLQEAPRLSWSLQQMVEYLDAVVVTPDAQPAG